MQIRVQLKTPAISSKFSMAPIKSSILSLHLLLNAGDENNLMHKQFKEETEKYMESQLPEGYEASAFVISQSR